MNKKLLSVAVIAALSVPVAANAGSAKVYGAVHVALQSVTVGDADAKVNIDGTSSKATKLGIKGSTDTNLMDFKAVYKFEMGMNQLKDSYYQRDTWVGMSSKSMGTVRAGTIKTPWKATSVMVDPLFTTTFESRSDDLKKSKFGIGGASKNLAGGKGVYNGRGTQTVRYDSPSIAGAKVSANYAFAEGRNALGLGVVYKMSGVTAFANFQSTDTDLSAMKFGAKAKFGAIGVSGAYEIDSGALSGKVGGEMNYLNVAATYGMGATTFIVKYGMNSESKTDAKDDRSGFALVVSQKVAKKVAIYGGYGASTGNTASNTDFSVLALGLNAKF